MTTITLPPDLEDQIADEARRRGTTPELLALDGLRRLFPPPAADDGANGPTLFDFLTGHVGAVAGSTEPLSERCGRHLADGLEEEQRRDRP